MSWSRARGTWLAALSGLWMAASYPAYRRFRKLMEHSENAQRATLARALAAMRGSAYARAVGLDRVRTPTDLMDVPVVSYDDLAPWIGRIAAGERDVLTTQPVLMMETTGGSTAAAKYIPYTAGLRDEFNRALAPWMFDLYTGRPRMLAGASYWSVSPSVRPAAATAGGVPIGFEDDTEYFGGLERFAMGQLMPVPPAVARIADVDANRYATLRYLLAEDRLALISVWNPSFLTLLLEYLDRHADALIRDLADGAVRWPAGEDAIAPAVRDALRAGVARDRSRARALDAIRARHGRLVPGLVWPHVAVISCWASAAAARYLEPVRAAFPRAEIQPKGLLATEGVVSFPLWDQPHPVLAIDSHFYEFQKVDGSGYPLLAHQVVEGEVYELLITTSGGLCRYRLGDRVRIAGWADRTPLIAFEERAGTSDQCGEKLSEGFVAGALDAALAAAALRPAWALVAPRDGTPPRYVVYVDAATVPDAALRALAERLDAALRANPHYAYCRELGQLEALEPARVDGGAAAYAAACVQRGQKPGAIKCVALHAATGWDELLGARRVASASL